MRRCAIPRLSRTRTDPGAAVVPAGRDRCPASATLPVHHRAAGVHRPASSPRTAILLLQALALGFVLMCARGDGLAEGIAPWLTRRSNGGARDATEPDAATRLRDVIQRILEATDPAQAWRGGGPLAQAADGWRDARRLLVSPCAPGRYAPAIAALETWSPTPRAWTSAACSPAWAAPSNGTAPSPRPTPPPASRPKTPACTPRAYAARSGRSDRGRRRVARQTHALALAAPADAHWWMLAHARHGDAAEAAGIAAALDATNLPNARVATVVRALLDDDRIAAAIRLGDAALEAGHDSPPCAPRWPGAPARATETTARSMRWRISRRACGRSVGRAAVDAAWRNAAARRTLGRRAAAGTGHRPGAGTGTDPRPCMRARCATQRYDEAADQLLHLVTKSPDKPLWQRSAIGALSQAGRPREAEALFERYRATRPAPAADLPGSPGPMDERLDSAPIPQARLDWPGRCAGRTGRPRTGSAARWGHLVDHLLFDWLECREDSVEEAMQLLGELDTGERFFAPLLAAGRGVVVATAHVGPMYAGLMALELLGIPSRWLATRRIARSSYAAALISTADQTEAQVAKACMRALASGHVLCLAVDGAPIPPRRASFAGQEVTYSGFAAHLAHRQGVPSCSMRLAGERQGGHAGAAARRDARRDADAYALRWRQAYFEHLRAHVAGPPENLRLSGGIWRHVQAADRSAPR